MNLRRRVSEPALLPAGLALAGDDRCACYYVGMARKARSQRRKADTRPFFDLLDQMESLLATIDLDWPEEESADAYRRLSRLARALRLARETRERYSG